MSSKPALSLVRPEPGVRITDKSVDATGIDISVANGYMVVTLPDETQLRAFISGLEARGILFMPIEGLQVRFYLRGNH